MNNKTKIAILKALKPLNPNVTRKIFNNVQIKPVHETISAGGQHSLGLKADGTVICWGSNEYGQKNPPKYKNNNGQNKEHKFIAISAGINHSLGLKADGTVIGWGDNFEGQINPQNDKFIAISAGYDHSLGLKADGTVIGWGSNQHGQIDPPSNTKFKVLKQINNKPKPKPKHYSEIEKNAMIEFNKETRLLRNTRNKDGKFRKLSENKKCLFVNLLSTLGNKYINGMGLLKRFQDNDANEMALRIKMNKLKLRE